MVVEETGEIQENKSTKRSNNKRGRSGNRADVAVVHSVDALIGNALSPNTKEGYDRCIVLAKGDGDTVTGDNVLEYLLEHAQRDKSINQVKRMVQALKYYGHNTSTLREDWPKIMKAYKGARKYIRDNKDEAPSRPTLSVGEMKKVVDMIGDTGPTAETAFIFCLTAMLAWRFASIEELRPNHISQ
jgi:hypothetical protein